MAARGTLRLPNEALNDSHHPCTPYLPFIRTPLSALQDLFHPRPPAASSSRSCVPCVLPVRLVVDASFGATARARGRGSVAVPDTKRPYANADVHSAVPAQAVRSGGAATATFTMASLRSASRPQVDGEEPKERFGRASDELDVHARTDILFCCCSSIMLS